MRAGCSSRSLGPETASGRSGARRGARYLRRERARYVALTDRWARVLQPFGAAREPVLDRVQDRTAIAHRAGQVPARRAIAQQRRSASVGRDESDSGSTSCRKRLIPHSTPYSHRLLSRKRRPRRGRQRRPPPTARPRRCGPGAGCEGSPREAAALQSRRQWRHLGDR